MKKNLGFGPSVLRTLFSAALLSLAMTGAAQATTIAVQAISGGSNFNSFNSTNQTIGWEFRPTSNIWVTDLGFWDASPGSPLNQTHQVGLWTDTGTLLASTLIQTTSALVGEFRYEAIASVALTAGTTYLIGAAITSPFSDPYKNPGARTLATEITLLGSARNGSSQGFSAPTTVTVGNGRIGPNFQFTTVDPNTVPEPASLALFAIGLAGFAARRRAA